MKNINIKYLLLISVIVSFASCSSIRTYKANRYVSENSLKYNSTFLAIDSNNVANYECNEYVKNALNNYSIELMYKDFRFLKNTHETVSNIHNPQITDTVYSFSNKKNSIRFYKTKSKEIIFVFDVTSPKLDIKDNIKIGMSKEAFIQKFRITKPFDTKIQLVNSMRNNKILFQFKRNILVQITADLYID